jgi:hypothetical protein
MNDVSIYIDDKQLVVVYGTDERTITMELETDAERELVNGLIGDVNLWASFLSSLSAAMNKDNQEKVSSE